MATNPDSPWWEPRKKTGSYKPPESNFWRDLSKRWNYWRYSYPFESAGMYDFDVPLGYNTPQTYTPDLPATNIGAPSFYLGNNTPPAAATTPTSAAPNVPPYVGGGQSGLVPWVNPATGRVEMPPAGDGYAKNLTTGNVPVGNSYADWQAWNKQMETSDPNWSYYNPYTSQYAWQWNPKEPGTLMAGADPRSQEGVPWHEELNIPWSSSYAPEFYSTQPRKPLVGITGGTNRRTMGTRDWRTRNRWEKALEDKREDENPAGNNNMKTIPAWVGPLVSWRT